MAALANRPVLPFLLPATFHKAWSHALPTLDNLNYLPVAPYTSVGRYCALARVPEISDLKPGLDFRKPQYRRAVFLQFYLAHLVTKSHPGAVYYAIPWLVKRHRLNKEQALWLAFLNGNTQHIITTWMLFERFPDVHTLDLAKLSKWFNENYAALGWDMDRRYMKKEFLKSVAVYKGLVQGSQSEYWKQVTHGPDKRSNFATAWEAIRKEFWSFGRLSTFSYLEYLRIVGLGVDCANLFLEDMAGSKSHRNGLAKVLGRDDLDWHKTTAFTGDYAPAQLPWLNTEAAALLHEAHTLALPYGADVLRDVSYFTMESALCTYKSWHRKNRRYPNVYNDMFHDRIKGMERAWPKENFKQFWQARAATLPEHLLLECNPNDPGLCAEKQNHYRETGEVVMLRHFNPVFDNAFERKYYGEL